MIDQILRDVIQEELGASGSVDASAVVGQLLDSSAVQQLVERVANMNKKSQKSQHSAVNIPQNIRGKTLPCNSLQLLVIAISSAVHCGINLSIS